MRPELDLPCLCLVTDRNRVSSGDIVGMVRQAVDGGVGMVQLRGKDLPTGELLVLAKELRLVTRGRALLIVNDRADVAILAEADGVQLGENAIDVPSARRLLREDKLIGRSVHSLEGARVAAAGGADFLILGTIFETASHPGVQTGGLDLVHLVTSEVSVPTLCIGGITDSNVGTTIEAGADGVAVISAISMAEDPRDAASRLSRSLRQSYEYRLVLGND